MKAKPLTKKDIIEDISFNFSKRDKDYILSYYKKEDIESAVEWLKEQMFRDDDITPRSYKEVNKLIDEAFKGVEE